MSRYRSQSRSRSWSRSWPITRDMDRLGTRGRGRDRVSLGMWFGLVLEFGLGLELGFG